MGALMQGPKAKPVKQPAILGFIMYEGPSVLDPTRNIVSIMTFKTSNDKTGNMAQLWILDAGDLNPLELSKARLDASICGNCVHRHSNGGACYVNLAHAPLAIYKAYKRGRYTHFDATKHAHWITTRKVRLGAYGDPSAMPFAIVNSIVKLAISHTGYVHQLAHPNFDMRFINICMVSSDTPKQALKAQALGAHTFRVALAGDTLAEGEVECLADSKGLSCFDCGLCDGTKGNVAITVHGSRAKRFNSKMINLTEVA